MQVNLAVYRWFAREVTAVMLVVKNKGFFLLATKLHFHVNSSRKNKSIALTPNMAAMSRGCKPRIRHFGNEKETGAS